MANELDELEKFLNISSNETNKTISENGVLNGSSVIKWNIRQKLCLDTLITSLTFF